MSRGRRAVKILAPVPYVSAGHTPIALVKALKYDEDEGLDLTIENAVRPADAIQGVLDGKGDATFVNTSFCIFYRDRGEPLCSFFGFVARPVRWFAVPQDSPIKSLADLKGATIGIDFPDLLNYAKAALADAGIDPERDVRFETLPMFPIEQEQLTSAVRSGAIQGLFQYDLNEGFFELAGIRLRRLPDRTLQHLTPASCLHTTDNNLKARPDVLTDLGRAVARATLFAITNPEAAIRHLWSVVPETRPAPGEETRTLKRDLAILTPRLANQRREGSPDPRWGGMTAGEFANWQDILLRSGGIKARRDPREYFTDQLIEGFNQFDAKAVVDQALGEAMSAAAIS